MSASSPGFGPCTVYRWKMFFGPRLSSMHPKKGLLIAFKYLFDFNLIVINLEIQTVAKISRPFLLGWKRVTLYAPFVGSQ